MKHDSINSVQVTIIVLHNDRPVKKEFLLDKTVTLSSRKKSFFESGQNRICRTSSSIEKKNFWVKIDK